MAERPAPSARSLLRGARVRLTAMRPRDVPTLARWFGDDTLLRLYDALPARPRTESDLTEWLETARTSDTVELFAVRSVVHDDLLGFVELDGILWNHGVAGVGACIGDVSERGRGYGKEALTLALDFAYDELNLHRIVATMFAYNEASIGLVESLGFRREGVHREHIQRGGRRYDMYLYGLLRPEWRSHRA